MTTVTSRRDKRYKEKLRGESSQRRATSHGTPPPHDDRIATVSVIRPESESDKIDDDEGAKPERSLIDTPSSSSMRAHKHHARPVTA